MAKIRSGTPVHTYLISITYPQYSSFFYRMLSKFPTYAASMSTLVEGSLRQARSPSWPYHQAQQPQQPQQPLRPKPQILNQLHHQQHQKRLLRIRKKKPQITQLMSESYA